MIDKWKKCTNCKCDVDFKIAIRLSEARDAMWHTRKDYFNLCPPCFNKLIPNKPRNQYRGYPRWSERTCNTCNKQIIPVTNYYISGTVQYSFSLWDWDSYKAHFCTDCIWPYKHFMKEENIVSKYAHINYKPRDEQWGLY